MPKLSILTDLTKNPLFNPSKIETPSLAIMQTKNKTEFDMETNPFA